MNENVTKNGKTYTQDEAFQSSLEYFKGDELAARVWVNKYALKDSYGNIFEKNPDDMHRRLAREIARIDNRYPNPLSEDAIFEVLRDFKYIVPQGGPMTGIGNDFQIASLSNCFVIGNEGPSDSYGGVMKIDQEQVQLMKRRGGVGHDLSHIRPKGSPVKNSALTSTGIVPFMERYSNSTREVAQDGRRGALMLSVSINHPDSESFIDAKMTEGKVTGANVSVKIDDEFMRAVINDEEYVQKYPVFSENPMYTKTIKARDLWNKIVHNAWKSAEPGILIVMPIWATARCPRTLAARFLCARMTPAACWQSTSIPMCSILFPRTLVSIFLCSRNTWRLRSASWTTSLIWNWKKSTPFWRRFMPTRKAMN